MAGLDLAISRGATAPSMGRVEHGHDDWDKSCKPAGSRSFGRSILRPRVVATSAIVPQRTGTETILRPDPGMPAQRADIVGIGGGLRRQSRSGAAFQADPASATFVGNLYTSI
jgi:hypothetical protein